MGANHINEIGNLCEIALPNWGYITNFGKAHLEGFGSEAGIIQGKSELYTHLIQNQGQILINGDDPKQLEQTKNYQVVQFGCGKNSDFKIEALPGEGNHLELKFRDYRFKSPLYGTYNLSNIAAAIAFGALFEVPLTDIQKAIAQYDSKNNRSQKLKIKGIQLILDAYNANPSSMEVALRAFAKNQTKNNAVILGDMMELGKQSEIEHHQVLTLCLELGFSHIYTLGSQFKKTHLIHPTIEKFEDLNALFQAFKASPKKTDRILIKGSRSMQLERIIPFLNPFKIMRKFLFFGVFITLLGCQASDERCGAIIQKVERDNTFYFVLQTDEYINYYNTPNQPNLPDDGVRQGIVSKEVFDDYEVGETYCSEL